MITEKEIETINKFYPARDHNNKKGLGFGLIHYAFIRNLRPVKVLVVGSQRGFIPVICALACKHEGKGHVDFVDAGYDLKERGKEGKESWGGIGIWKTVGKEYWRTLQLEDYITLYAMTTDRFSKYLKIADTTYDYIYIDGNHSYEGISLDYNLFWRYLAKYGFMTFHDVLVEKETDWGKCGVKKFWNEIKQKNAGCVTINQSAGLGILQKTI